MKHSRFIFSWLCAGLLVAGLWDAVGEETSDQLAAANNQSEPKGANDPVINRKKLSKWVKQLRGGNRGLQIRAARALGKAPENLRTVISLKIIPILKSTRENDRFVTAQILGEYGPAAKAAVKDILPMLKGTQFERNRAAASKALGKILIDSKPGPEISKIVDMLITATKDKYIDVRREAVRALGMIGPAAKACIPHMVPRLKEHKPGVTIYAGFGVRKEAAWTLYRMGKHATPQIDLLISMMHVDYVNLFLFDAIGAIGPVHENVAPNLVDMLEKRGPNGRILSALEKFGPKGVIATDVLARFINSWKGNRGSRIKAKNMTHIIIVLKAIGPDAKGSVEALKGLMAMKFHMLRGSHELENPKDWAEMKQTIADALLIITKQKVEVLHKVQTRKR